MVQGANWKCGGLSATAWSRGCWPDGTVRGARASQTPHKHKKIPTPPAPQRSHPAPTHGHHRAGPIPTPPEIKQAPCFEARQPLLHPPRKTKVAKSPQPQEPPAAPQHPPTAARGPGVGTQPASFGRPPAEWPLDFWCMDRRTRPRRRFESRSGRSQLTVTHFMSSALKKTLPPSFDSRRDMRRPL